MSDTARAIWVRVFLLALWVAAAAGAIGVVDPEPSGAAVGVALLAAVAGLAVLRPMRRNHLVLAGVAAAAYVSLQALRLSAADVDPDAPHVPAAAVGALALALTAVVVEQTRRAVVHFDAELGARGRALSAMQSVDASTGATKREHAGRILESEVDRARRYGRSLALVVVGPDAWEPPNDARLAEEQLARAAAGFRERLRTVDTLVRMDGADFAALLPETDLEGAQIVAQKLAESGGETLGVAARAGVATFPDDEVTGAGLLEEAAQAREFARAAALPVASRALLS